MTVIQNELQDSGKTTGCRAMWKRLGIKYGLKVNKDMVFYLFNNLDPDDIELWKKKKAQTYYRFAGPSLFDLTCC